MKIYLKKTTSKEDAHNDAHRLLAEIYKKEYTLSYNEYSKPYIEGDKDFHFNISHSGEWICLATSSREIGIDIEMHSENRMRLANRFFSEKEKEYCKSTKDFFDIWTKKEAYIKAVGKGLSLGMASFCSFEKQEGFIIKTLDAPCGYSLSVCEKTDVLSDIEIIYK